MEQNMTSEELQQLLADARRYRDEARRYRDEARQLRTETAHHMKAFRLERDLMPEESKKWITEGIPTRKGVDACYGVGGDSYLLYRKGSGKDEYKAYQEQLLQNGFQRYSEGEVGTLRHSCFVNDQAIVNLSFSTSDGVLRSVVEDKRKTELPPLDEIRDGDRMGVAPKVVLFGDLYYEAADCGMGYIFRMEDGTFLVIDGPFNAPNTVVDHFFGHLESLAEGGPIVISAWILTHAHPDHTRIFSALAKKYADRVQVRRLIHNFPGKMMLYGSGHQNWAEYEYGLVEGAIKAYQPSPTFIRAHTGQTYRFPGLSVDILFTLDDFKQPFFPDNFNATSLVFRLTVAGQTFMFLGDTDPTAIGIFQKRFGDLLKSDVVQVAHHGYYGGTKEVYDVIAAPIVLWPVPYIHPITKAGRYNDPNFSMVTREMIRDHAKAVYLQWKGTDILSLPLSGLEGNTLMTDED